MSTETERRPPGGRIGATARRVGIGATVASNWAQLFKFALVGASGYLVNLTVFAIAVEVAGAHHLVAAVIAFCVAVANNYHWNRRWTFSTSPARRSYQAARFFTVSVIALTVNLGLLELLVGPVGLAALLSQAIAVAAATPVNFIGNKLWTFESPSSPVR